MLQQILKILISRLDPTPFLGTMMNPEGYSAGATSNCKDCEICVSLENENTLTDNQGIFTRKHFNQHFEMPNGKVIIWTTLPSILSHHSISNNHFVGCYV